MNILELTAAGLQDFIDSEEFESLPVLPISRHRAVSQIQNPRLEVTDKILFIAYEGKAIIGYLGVVPDFYYINGEKHKVGWLSCFWVAPEARGKGVSVELGTRAVQSWNYRLVATEFTISSKKLWLKINALDIFTTLHGIRGFFRFNLTEILPRKKRLFEQFKGMLKLGDFILNLGNETRIKKLSRPIKGYNIITLDNPDEECDRFIHLMNRNELFKRELPDFNWIMRHPWIISGCNDDDLGSRYYFSSVESRFEFRLLKVKNTENRLVAVLLISIRNKHLKLPYAWFQTKDTAEVLNVIYYLLHSEGIATFTTYNPDLTAYIRNIRYPFIYTKEQHREYLATGKVVSTFGADFPYKIQDGDGDCVFT
jgi:GNAT superfamily N-acetyltransferase